MDRKALIVRRMEERLAEVCAAVPPLDPPSAHWLDSDAGPDYCFDCAIIARGCEFELGPLIHVPAWYQRNEWHDAFFEGIDGGFDTTSDSASACSICHRTLSYILTEGGVLSEIDYYREAPLVAVRDEDSYALDRLALNVWAGHPNKAIITGVAMAVNQAWRVVQRERADG